LFLIGIKAIGQTGTQKVEHIGYMLKQEPRMVL